jgi:TPP-dependent pyruvate/acetoin dehydrogenase alpha subunit
VADDEHYRDLESNNPWQILDPLRRLADYLVESGTASRDEVDGIYEEASRAVEEAIEYGKQAPEPPSDTLYDGMYSPEFMQSRGKDL